MRVGVALFGQYLQLLPSESENGHVFVDVQEAATVGEVLDLMQIPPEGRTYVTVNGKHVGEDVALADKDEIRVIVPLGGG